MLAFNLWFAESDPHIEEIYVGFSTEKGDCEEERKMIEKEQITFCYYR